MQHTDISPLFTPNERDAAVIRLCMRYEATPKAIRVFRKHCHQLTDYGYWFLLGTLWVSYTCYSDLDQWKRLFRSPRPNQAECLMKPSELEVFRELPEIVTAYRAHRPAEKDWISYTLDMDTAFRFAAERHVDNIAVYEIPRDQVLTLFLRRGEQEIIVLDRRVAESVGSVPLPEVEHA